MSAVTSDIMSFSNVGYWCHPDELSESYCPALRGRIGEQVPLYLSAYTRTLQQFWTCNSWHSWRESSVPIPLQLATYLDTTLWWAHSVDINLSSLLVTESSNALPVCEQRTILMEWRRMKAYNKVIKTYKVHYYLIIELSTSLPRGPNLPFNVNHASTLVVWNIVVVGYLVKRGQPTPKQIYFYSCPRVKYLNFLLFWLFYMTSARAGFKSSRRDSPRISPPRVSPLSFDSSRRVTFTFQ